jgi:hypothetical protein
MGQSLNAESGESAAASFRMASHRVDTDPRREGGR